MKISYKLLRKINPETARTAVLEYLSSNGGNVSDCSKTFGITRVVIYDIIRKGKEGDLKDRHKAPKKIHNKTEESVEDLIVQTKITTGLPPKRLGYYLLQNYNLNIAYGTIRNILRRHRLSQ